jgi:hypothetical protein
LQIISVTAHGAWAVISVIDTYIDLTTFIRLFGRKFQLQHTGLQMKLKHLSVNFFARDSVPIIDPNFNVFWDILIKQQALNYTTTKSMNTIDAIAFSKDTQELLLRDCGRLSSSSIFHLRYLK